MRTFFEDIKDDIEKENIPKGDFWQTAAKSEIPKDKSYLSTAKEYGKSALKGFASGITKLGQTMGGIRETPRFDENGELILPRSKKQQQEEFDENLDLILPNEGEESFGQRALRRGAGIIPEATGSPGKPIQAGVRSLLAGLSAEGVKELGGGELAQAAAEITSFIGPDITKKLLESGKNKEIIKIAREFGLTDEQIAPLIQSEFKQKWLTKLSPKKGRTQSVLENTKKGLSNAYNIIESNPLAKGEISEIQNGKLINSLRDILKDMPRAQQNKIMEDMADLLDNPITGKSLINFYKDINNFLGGDKKALGRLKEPVKNALYSISPDLGKDFNNVTNLYEKYAKISSKLKPNLMSDIVGAGEALGGMYAGMNLITTGNITPMVSILGEQAVKHITREMLVNPRLQQLGSKMVSAINNNKYKLAKYVMDQFSNEIAKTDPKSADKIQEIGNKELVELFNRKSSTEQSTSK
jgi:hypothetical protein